jgi:hypothetical protein
MKPCTVTTEAIRSATRRSRSASAPSRIPNSIMQAINDKVPNRRMALSYFKPKVIRCQSVHLATFDDVMKEAILTAGKLAAWLDLQIPWNEVNDVLCRGQPSSITSREDVSQLRHPRSRETRLLRQSSQETSFSWQRGSPARTRLDRPNCGRAYRRAIRECTSGAHARPQDHPLFQSQKSAASACASSAGSRLMPLPLVRASL